MSLAQEYLDVLKMTRFLSECELKLDLRTLRGKETEYHVCIAVVWVLCNFSEITSTARHMTLHKTMHSYSADIGQAS
jgi:hypothetical protein